MLEPFKYAGYPMLLQAVTLPEDDNEAKSFLGPEQAPQLQVLSSRSMSCSSHHVSHSWLGMHLLGMLGLVIE